MCRHRSWLSTNTACEASGETPSALESCSNVPCSETYLIVSFELRVFYEDAFYSTIVLELSHTLNAQQKRVVGVARVQVAAHPRRELGAG